MAELDQLARPMMGRAAGLKANKASGQLREEGQHVLAPECLGDDYAPRGVNAMNLEDMLGQIKANGRDRRQIGDRLSHGRIYTAVEVLFEMHDAEAVTVDDQRRPVADLTRISAP